MMDEDNCKMIMKKGQQILIQFAVQTKFLFVFILLHKRNRHCCRVQTTTASRLSACCACLKSWTETKRRIDQSHNNRQLCVAVNFSLRPELHTRERGVNKGRNAPVWTTGEYQRKQLKIFHSSSTLVFPSSGTSRTAVWRAVLTENGGHRDPYKHAVTLLMPLQASHCT
jgi:hypothetical protein